MLGSGESRPKREMRRYDRAMRSRATLFTTLLVAGLFVLPHVAQASIPFFGPIIPEANNQCAASWGMLIDVINNIISLLLTLAIVFVAPLMIAYAGFLFVVNPVNASGKEEAKKILTHTITGIVIALAGWLIVDAIMAALYSPKDIGKTWSSLVTSGGVALYCIPLSQTLNQTKSGGQITGVSSTGAAVSVVPPSTAPASEATIRNQFASAGVEVNHPEPCNPYNLNGVTNGCTNVGGMLSATVSQVIAVKNACGSECTVRVTAGSEAGHASGAYSHGTGYKVDLGLAPKLDAFLKGMEQKGSRSGGEPGPIYVDKCGKNQYVLTSDHWDITVYEVCSSLK